MECTQYAMFKRINFFPSELCGVCTCIFRLHETCFRRMRNSCKVRVQLADFSLQLRISPGVTFHTFLRLRECEHGMHTIRNVQTNFFPCEHCGFCTCMFRFYETCFRRTQNECKVRVQLADFSLQLRISPGVGFSTFHTFLRLRECEHGSVQCSSVDNEGCTLMCSELVCMIHSMKCEAAVDSENDCSCVVIIAFIARHLVHSCK